MGLAGLTDLWLTTSRWAAAIRWPASENMATGGAEWAADARLGRDTSGDLFDFWLRKTVLAVSSCTEALQVGGASSTAAPALRWPSAAAGWTTEDDGGGAGRRTDLPRRVGTWRGPRTATVISEHAREQDRVKRVEPRRAEGGIAVAGVSTARGDWLEKGEEGAAEKGRNGEGKCQPAGKGNG